IMSIMTTIFPSAAAGGFMTRPRTLAVFAVLALFTSSAVAQPGKDHPLISRFPGAEIKSSGVKDFDEISVPTGRVRLRAVSPSRSVAQVDKTLRLEGKVTR